MYIRNQECKDSVGLFFFIDTKENKKNYIRVNQISINYLNVSM